MFKFIRKLLQLDEELKWYIIWSEDYACMYVCDCIPAIAIGQLELELTNRSTLEFLSIIHLQLLIGCKIMNLKLLSNLF